MSDSQLREFNVSKGKRRANSLHLIVSTVGGKIAVGLVAVLLLLAAASPLYTPAIAAWEMAHSYDYNADDASFTAIVVPVFWLAMAFMAAACTFRQRNVGVAMRDDEHLSLEGSILTYSFHSSGDRHSAASRNVIMIDLDASRISFDEIQRHWVYEGGVFGHYYRYPADEPLLSMREMEAIPRFTISSHFEDPFDSIIQTYAKGGQL